MGVTAGVRGWSESSHSAGLLCFANEGDIGKLSRAPAIWWMLGGPLSPHVSHWPQHPVSITRERRGEDWKHDWKYRSTELKKDLARKIGRDVRSSGAFSKKFLCSNWGEDQVRDDNKRLREKSPVTKYMAWKGLKVRKLEKKEWKKKQRLKGKTESEK